MSTDFYWCASGDDPNNVWPCHTYIGVSITRPNIITSGITVRVFRKIIENKLNKIWWNGFNFISLLLLITNTKENESHIKLEPISYH